MASYNYYKGGRMKITQFATLIAKEEGKKVPVSIAQISEILKIANRLTRGLMYAFIRKLK